MSKKLAKAKELGVNIITEEQLKQMCGVSKPVVEYDAVLRDLEKLVGKVVTVSDTNNFDERGRLVRAPANAFMIHMQFGYFYVCFQPSMVLEVTGTLIIVNPCPERMCYE